MKTERDDIVLVSRLYVIIGNMNIAVQEIKPVFLRKTFGKGIIFAAYQRFSFSHTLYHLG